MQPPPPGRHLGIREGGIKEAGEVVAASTMAGSLAGAGGLLWCRKWHGVWLCAVDGSKPRWVCGRAGVSSAPCSIAGWCGVSGQGLLRALVQVWLWGSCGVLSWWDLRHVDWQLSAVIVLPAGPEPAALYLPGSFPRESV